MGSKIDFYRQEIRSFKTEIQNLRVDYDKKFVDNVQKVNQQLSNSDEVRDLK